MTFFPRSAVVPNEIAAASRLMYSCIICHYHPYVFLISLMFYNFG